MRRARLEHDLLVLRAVTLEHVVEESREQSIPGQEVVTERALGDAGALRHGILGQPLGADLVDNGLGAVENGAAGALPLGRATRPMGIDCRHDHAEETDYTTKCCFYHLIGWFLC